MPTERRELQVGDANDEFMEILDGIKEGEKVVMNPRTHFSREINELEVRLLGEQEDQRERTKVPKRASQGPAGGSGRPGGGKPGGGGKQQAGSNGRGPGGGGGPPDPKTIFDRVDKNKDGFITKDEGDMRGKFDEYDADGDGKLTLDELKKAFSK